jgi:hypothetical protein
MSSVDITKNFATSFKQATDGMSAYVYSNSIRFIAMMFVILAVIFCINHFMSVFKEQDDFLTLLGSRLVRLVLAFCCFILLLTVKGDK